MKYVEVIAQASSTETILKIAVKQKALDVRLGLEGDDGMRPIRLLVRKDRLQALIDDLQHILGAQPTSRILVMAVEATVPEPEESERERESEAIAAREELVETADRMSRLNLNYFILVLLSTLVAAIGLIYNQVAVIIGGMVIAPLLGPNLALSLSITLGNVRQVRQALVSLAVGVLVPIVVGALIGFFWTGELDSPAISARTNAGLAAATLGLTSGAAAALSLTSGISSALVGVMVSVALLPPATALGLMLGQGEYLTAAGAALLLAIDIVCINLACKAVFFFKGVRPRLGEDQERAKLATVGYALTWVASLAVLLLLNALRQQLLSAP
ncbi:TIGR00341 family protein [Motiliproteus sp. SC1-56]|uniref:TIGR00341 family protein n=1 Tax=Motiliproteus sp. SC1-56 TaxID=2799565 RepID=UPI001A8E54DB|nr:TIGR00341 family protein [Motiliproteus sp. SC1-56]